MHRKAFAVFIATLLAFVGLAPVASAETVGWAEWENLQGSAGNYRTTMQLPAEGFPQATVRSDSRGGVGAVSGQTTWIGENTPPGETYGSSRNNRYLNLRPRADRANTPSSTTYTFERPTPAGGWAFVLGDIDADEVTVTAKGPDGEPIDASDLGFQDTFNYCEGAGTPSCAGDDEGATWDPGAATLTGNADATDTEGASGWFEPTAPIKTLTMSFAWRSGFPVYQTWFASIARDIAGTVTARPEEGDPAPEGGVELKLFDPNGNEVATTTTAGDGTYSFPGYAAADGYTVEVDPPDGYVMDETAGEAGEQRREANISGEDDLDVDFALREIVPVHVSGTVTDTDGNPVPGATVTLSDGSSAVTDSEGYFEFDRVEPGEYTWDIDVPDGYDDAPVEQPEEPLVVPEDSEDPIGDQDFVVQQFRSLSGQVTAGGSGVGNVTVTITDGETRSTVTDEDGNYSFDKLPPDDYTVEIETPDEYLNVDPDSGSREETVADEDVENVDFELARPGALGGTVNDQDGKPVPGAEITVTGPDGFSETLTTDDEGNYYVDELPPGDYELTITVPDGYELDGPGTQTATITAAGETELDHDFDLTKEEEPGDNGPGGGGDEPGEGESPSPGESPGDGELPDTGADPAPLVAVGVVLLGLGAALLVRHVAGPPSR